MLMDMDIEDVYEVALCTLNEYFAIKQSKIYEAFVQVTETGNWRKI